MRIEVMFTGYGPSSSKICYPCPCCTDDEFGYRCTMGYAWSDGWLNCKTGLMATLEVGDANYENYIDGWQRVILRPQECIDEHGE